MTTKVIVYHGGYGCATGCCGHWVKLADEPEQFQWEHPQGGEDPRAFAERLITEEFGEAHVADLDWEHSEILEWERCDVL
jgi:hypothetical protein